MIGEAGGDVGEERKRYKYPLARNGHLSHGSAAAQVRQCRSTAVALPRCGTTAPGKTAMVIVKCWLSWL